MTKHTPVDQEEMQKRLDADYHAMLQMIGEGSPVFESYPNDANDRCDRQAKHVDKDLQ